MAAVTSTVMAAAAVVGAGASIMQGREASKQADKQYAAQQAAFTDDIQAAITNAQWSLKDNSMQFSIDNQQRDELLSIALDSLGDRGELEHYKAEGQASIEALKNILSSEVDATDLIKNMQTRAKSMLEEATINMEYTKAMANGRQDYNTSKAILDSIEYAGLAQAAVTFLDQEINTLREQMSFALETVDIEAVEAIGKSKVKLASSLVSGNSADRVLIQSKIKADRVRQGTKQKFESAIDKAYATQNKSISETDARVRAAINTAVAQNALITKETAASLARTVDLTDVNLEELYANTKNSIDSIQATLNNNLEVVGKDLGLNQDIIDMGLKSEIDKTIDETALDKEISTQKYNLANMQTMRGLEQSYATAVKNSQDKDAKLKEYAEWTKTPEYAQYSEWANSQGIVSGVTNILGGDITQYGLSTDSILEFNKATNGQFIDEDKAMEIAEGYSRYSVLQGGAPEGLEDTVQADKEQRIAEQASIYSTEGEV